MIPGTTVDYGGTPLTCGDTDVDGVEVFVGGVSTGNVGLAVMRYQNPLTGALGWQKAWAFVEGDVQHVMINNIVQHLNVSDDGDVPPVFSVLDQRTHNGDVWVDGLPLSVGGNFSGARSLWHAGVGYLFPESKQGAQISSAQLTQLSVDFGNRTGNWSTIGISKQVPPTVDLFSAWLVHSPDPASNAGSGSSAANLNALSYSTYPGTSSYSDFVEKSRKNMTRGLVEARNDAHVSAVYDTRRHRRDHRRDSEQHSNTGVRTAYIVFWDSQGGEIDLTADSLDGHLRRWEDETVTVSSDIGLLVIIEEKDSGEWCTTVADPTQAALSATVAVKFGDGQPREMKFELPQGGSAGSSVSQSFWV